MVEISRLRSALLKLVQNIRPMALKYRFSQWEGERIVETPRMSGEQTNLDQCPSCGMPIAQQTTKDVSWFHNAETCRLVNLVLSELGVSFDPFIQVDVYPGFGPLKGYYSPTDPYAIHVSDEAYSQFPQYIIFHETKHLVDCLTKGWSEEGPPDAFARSLCAKYGFRSPPPHLHFNNIIPYNVQFAPWSQCYNP